MPRLPHVCLQASLSSSLNSSSPSAPVSLGGRKWGGGKQEVAGGAVGTSEKLPSGRRGILLVVSVCFPGRAGASPPDPVGSTREAWALPRKGWEGEPGLEGASGSQSHRPGPYRFHHRRLVPLSKGEASPAQVTRLLQGPGAGTEARGWHRWLPNKNAGPAEPGALRRHSLADVKTSAC